MTRMFQFSLSWGRIKTDSWEKKKAYKQKFHISTTTHIHTHTGEKQQKNKQKNKKEKSSGSKVQNYVAI